MKTEDLKGHLLARKANLTNHGRAMTSRMLTLERQLEDVVSEVAATEGAVKEIDQVLALIDPTAAECESKGLKRI